MTSAELKLASTSACPRCGAGLRCGRVAGDAECWCVQLPHVMPVPRPHPNPPPEGEGTDLAAASCFCPACLQQITDVSIHAPFGANLEEVTPLPNKFYPPEVGGFKPESVLDERHNKLAPARD